MPTRYAKNLEALCAGEEKSPKLVNFDAVTLAESYLRMKNAVTGFTGF